MRANYRTSEGTWGTMAYPFISVELNENGSFTLCGFTSEMAMQHGSPIAGVADVLEYQLCEDED